MSFLPTAELPQTFEPLASLRDQFGFVPKIFSAQALLPRAIQAEAGLAEAILLRERGLTRLDKETLLVAAAGGHRNAYCITTHGEMLRLLGVPDAQVDLIATDHRRAGLSSRRVALIDFALTLSRAPTRISAADVDALRGYAFSDEQILEAVAVTGLTEFLCSLSVGLGVTPDFAPRQPAWAEAAPHPSPAAAQSPPAQGPYLEAVPLTAEAFAPFAFFREKFGFIPNLFRAQTLRPDFVEAEARMVDSVLLAGDVLSRVRKEFILLVVSAANLNTYCVAVHSEILGALGVSVDDADRVALDHRRAGLSEADVALLDFALKLARRPDDYGPGDIDALREHGFTEVEILEGIVMVALTAFLNTLQMGLGTVPDFEPLRVFREAADETRTGAAVHPSSQPASPEDIGEAAVVVEAQAGNLDAFEQLVRRHHARVYRTLIAVTGSREDAEDDLQAAFLKAYQHLREFRRGSSFAAWLTRIAINEALQRLRARKPAESLDDMNRRGEGFRPREIEAWEDNPEQRYSKNELRELVEQELLKLPVAYRAAVVLRDLEELSTEESAAALGIEVTTLKWRLQKGRLLLREALAPRFSRPIGRSHV